MDTILAKLKEILLTLKDEFALKGVYILNDTNAIQAQKTTDYPCIILTPLGTNTVSGPFGGTRTRNCRIALRIVLQSSVDKTLNLKEENERNLLKIQDAVENLLVQNPQLTLDTSEEFAFRQSFEEDTIQFELLDSTNAGLFDASYTTLTYQRIESFYGGANETPGIQLNA